MTQIDGESTLTFGSFRVAEILLSFWGMDRQTNPILQGLNDRQIYNLVCVVDSTAIYRSDSLSIDPHAPNFWAVLARCEHDRLQLGPTEDRRIYEQCLQECRRRLFANPDGFFDDDPFGLGKV